MSLKSLRGAIFLFLCILVVIFIVYSYFGSNTALPSVSLPAPPEESGDISAVDNLGLGKYTAADLSPETVQTVVATLARIESYTRSVTVESFWEGGSSLISLDCHIDNSDAHIVETGNGRVRHCLILGESLYIWYDDEGGRFSGVVSGERLNIIDEFSHIFTYEELLALEVESISDAGFVNYNDEACIYADYSPGSLGYTSRVYVSISTGLLMGAEKYDGETLIYKMSSETPTIGAPETSWFMLPS